MGNVYLNSNCMKENIRDIYLSVIAFVYAIAVILFMPVICIIVNIEEKKKNKEQ